ncbi:hypothetical protein THOM_1711 [Trachipleistophora hominis]|uniref:Uncharacterized protein n=1 Tax=Trachipleistophora hominis TaxID=72359 RepID=L7JVK1_TRAHO|nr:hypothetical protein THOM_1711 [Trachipleistophora hominis]
MLFYYVAPQVSVPNLMLSDKSASPEHLSKIISALSMFPSSFLYAYAAMFFSERLFETESQKRS